jgi:hypothetical protein
MGCAGRGRLGLLRRKFRSGLTYPKVAPKPQTTGISAKPSALFVESVSSPMTLFMTPAKIRGRVNTGAGGGVPMFPFSRPVRHRLEDLIRS